MNIMFLALNVLLLACGFFIGLGVRNRADSERDSRTTTAIETIQSGFDSDFGEHLDALRHATDELGRGKEFLGRVGDSAEQIRSDISGLIDQIRSSSGGDLGGKTGE
jgi:hypothetical protein